MASDPNEQVDRTTTEARAGATPGVARYVLIFSTALIIVVFFLIWLLT